MGEGHEQQVHDLGLPACGEAEAGQQHDRDVVRRLRSLQARAEGGAVEPWHADVEHDRVRRPRLDHPASLGGVAGLDHVDVDRLERCPEQCAETVVVVYHQEAQTFLLSSAALVGTGPSELYAW